MECNLLHVLLLIGPYTYLRVRFRVDRSKPRWNEQYTAAAARRELLAALAREGLDGMMPGTTVAAVRPDEAKVRHHLAADEHRATAAAHASRDAARIATQAAETGAGVAAWAEQAALQAADRCRAEAEASMVPPALLVGKRVNVEGANRGRGTVGGPFKKGSFMGLGPSRHTICFDNGCTEKLLLRRHGNGGLSFVVLDDGFDDRFDPIYDPYRHLDSATRAIIECRDHEVSL